MAVLTVTLLLGACTPESGPGESPSPATSSASPSPTASPTPTENAQERQQRLDGDAAKKAYLDANREVDRLLMAGGANRPTDILLATTSGAYQKALMNVVQTFKRNDWHSDRSIPQIVAMSGGWSPTELVLTACEDTSKVKYLDAKGREVLKDRDRLYVHELTARKSGQRWTIAKIESKAVKDFAGASCDR